ncbi:hypothetical protein [Nostoc sp. C117]|uniref:hypothetical protein n=1 Tax=Nostoc sp. C117 TaxID=3349875 RepID=UPI00370DA691
MKIQLEKRRDLNRGRIEQFLFLVLSIAIVVSLPTWLSPNPFVIKQFGINDVTQLLSLLLLISLLLERSLEVFITTWRGSTVKELDVKVLKNKLKISEIKNVIEKQPQTEVSSETVRESTVNTDEVSGKSATVIKESSKFEPELINQLNVEIDDLRANELVRANYRSDTRKIALRSSFILGIIISAIGIRALETFINVKGLPSHQILVFRWLDVFLTGGLIAGGSEGIHKITQVFMEFFEATTEQIKDKSS